MRGHDEHHEGMMFSYLAPEKRVPADYRLPRIRAMTDHALQGMSPPLGELYSGYGRQVHCA